MTLTHAHDAKRLFLKHKNLAAPLVAQIQGIRETVRPDKQADEMAPIVAKLDANHSELLAALHRLETAAQSDEVNHRASSIERAKVLTDTSARAGAAQVRTLLEGASHAEVVAVATGLLDKAKSAPDLAAHYALRQEIQARRDDVEAAELLGPIVEQLNQVGREQHRLAFAHLVAVRHYLGHAAASGMEFDLLAALLANPDRVAEHTSRAAWYRDENGASQCLPEYEVHALLELVGVETATVKDERQGPSGLAA